MTGYRKLRARLLLFAETFFAALMGLLIVRWAW